jgi:hypothetical protein
MGNSGSYTLHTLRCKHVRFSPESERIAASH